MVENYILDDYFDWLYFRVRNQHHSKRASFRKLLSCLHSIDFRYSVDYDENRAADGVNMRWYYVDDGGYDEILQWDEPCTVLEMLIGLAIQMETIMTHPDIDYQAGHWFWMMISNLGLDYMSDGKFDRRHVYGAVSIFLDRAYEPDGYGNIIFIEDCDTDLRKVEIWQQMCWYLDSIL